MQKELNRIDVTYTCEDENGAVTKYYEHYPTKRECMERAVKLQDRYKRVSVSLDMMK